MQTDYALETYYIIKILKKGTIPGDKENRRVTATRPRRYNIQGQITD